MTKKLFLFIGIVFFTNILFAITPPTISNFRIEASEPDRVYFDSDKPIIGSSYNGFTISNKSISSITINEGQLSNHYLTVSEKFTYWDNNTIRYEGGSDIKDVNGNALIEFTLSYIVNNIPEPDANEYRYVTTSATGGGDGKSEDSAWTLEEAFDKANAGITVWIKAGNYGNQNLSLYNDGTPVSPLKFIGYKNSPGDITSNYYDYGKTWSTNEMPTLTGKSPSTGHAIQLMGVNYVVFRNLQITNYYKGIRANNTKNSNLIFDRVNGLTFGGNNSSPNDLNASFIDLATYKSGSGYRPFTSNNNMKVLDCRGVNASMGNFTLFGDGNNLIKDTKSYNDRTGKYDHSDYQISVNGHNNIITNCYAENFNTKSTNNSTHGIGIRGSSNLSNTYNLIEKSQGINIAEPFYIRNYGSNYNVIKDCVAGNNANSSNYTSNENTGVVWIWGGSNYNIIERVKGHNTTFGIGFKDNREEGNTNDNTIGSHNIIRNSVFSKTKYSIYVQSNNPSNAASTLINNTIINCTFDDSNYFYKEIYSKVSNLKVINSQILNVKKNVATAPSNSSLNVSFENSNFYNSWGTESGKGNISVDPKLDKYYKPTDNTPKSITEGGQISELVNYDYDMKFRGNVNTIGAYQYGENTTGYIDVDAGLDVEICKGSEISLTATIVGEGTFLWSTGETSSSINVSPEKTTTYTVTVTNGENSASDEVVVTVNDLPLVDLGEDVVSCSGNEVVLTAVGVGDFLWSTGETTPSITVSPTETTKYSVSASNACDSTVTDEILVKIVDSTVNAGDDVSICSGSEVTLTAEGADNYLWSTGETTASIIVSPTETTTYSVTSAIGECSISDDVVVTVTESPSVNLGEDLTVCSGSELTLTAEGSGNFLWNTGETSQTITVAPLETTTYIATASVLCGGENLSVSDTIVVNVIPGITLDAGEDITICGTSEVTLTATSSNGDYLWSTGETTPSITVTPSETTTYTVTSSSGECSLTDEVTVTVSTTPEVSLGDDISICSGSEVVLTANGIGDFLWNTGETTKSIIVNPTETSTYSVTASTLCGGENLSVSDSIVINVIQEITLNAGEDVTICRGEEITLTASGNGDFLWNTGETSQSIVVKPEETKTYTVSSGTGDCKVTDDVVVTVNDLASVKLGEDLNICYGDQVTLTAEGVGDFLWSTGETTASIIVNPLETTTYSVTATNGCGGTASDDIVVNVGKELYVDAGEDKSICVGESVVLTAEGTGNFLWSTGETTKSITVSPVKPESYWVSSSDGNCSVSDEVFVDVQRAAQVSLGEDITICSGEVVTLRATGHGNYLWSTGATTSSISVRPTETTTYTITASSSACMADATDEITVYVNESVVADAGNDVFIEPGDKYTLTATGGSTYLWSTGETTQSITVQPESTTIYSVNVGNGTNCSGYDEVKVTVENVPLIINNGEDLTICKGDELVLQARGSLNYLWNNGSMESEITVNPETTTIYTVSAQKNGVLETVDILVTVEDCTSKKAVEYSMYPNPSEGLININIPSEKTGVKFIVSALSGKIVYRGEVKGDTNGVFTQINLSHVADGIYFVKMYNDNFNATEKIIVI
ncbi:T9SS C-terminal target domain-containing protein [Aureibaculum marinum]|uniref:T9SS C-terminal target domain-containing protein n=1 Tax=Aureibaculum marinum TaxID=2487930 RepID=A0A3N4NS08_9FLAO|nr:T9SS type A sorting domain-containing protein [Aureibaculum marinum]RPD94369.1 T9SS C-terminal target domain-containing protein [Aureibaculum marinum]